MYVISTFKYSAYVELAITELEQKGIVREKILAVPLEKKKKEGKLFDTINRADGVSLFDLAAVLGTVFMVLGVIYGYIWAWGPILCGLIGLVGGSAVGFLIDLFIVMRRRRKGGAAAGSDDVVIIVNCDKESTETVEKVLWNNHAVGVARLDKVNEGGKRNDH